MGVPEVCPEESETYLEISKRFQGCPVICCVQSFHTRKRERCLLDVTMHWSICDICPISTAQNVSVALQVFFQGALGALQGCSRNLKNVPGGFMKNNEHCRCVSRTSRSV